MTQKLISDRENYIKKIQIMLPGIGCTRDGSRINELLTTALINIQIPIPGLNINDADRALIFTSVINGSYRGTKLALERILSDLLTMKVLIAESYIIQIFNTLAPRIVNQELNNIVRIVIYFCCINFSTTIDRLVYVSGGSNQRRALL